ncbi:MAG TPA: hypothetical protein LFW21_02305 [Rickettsia endosymbiont of Pyrocoelia pectoralis]|nr:hypothetical protein [Rickettsia endosymbiont of Pyrocoelia pectoralis]
MKKTQFFKSGKIKDNLTILFSNLLEDKILEKKENFIVTYKAISPDGKEVRVNIKETDPKTNIVTGGYTINFSQEDDIISYGIIGNSNEGTQILGQVFSKLSGS